MHPLSGPMPLLSLQRGKSSISIAKQSCFDDVTLIYIGIGTQMAHNFMQMMTQSQECDVSPVSIDQNLLINIQ